jgi:hypothetical protein
VHIDAPSSNISRYSKGISDRRSTVLSAFRRVASRDKAIPGVPGTGDGALIFKILRNALHAPDRGKVCVVARNPDAIWFNDCEKRVIFDEAGLYDHVRIDKKS